MANNRSQTSSKFVVARFLYSVYGQARLMKMQLMTTTLKKWMKYSR
jgi:hypothetical protein